MTVQEDKIHQYVHTQGYRADAGNEMVSRNSSEAFWKGLISAHMNVAMPPTAMYNHVRRT
jgi:hypothetical protein